VLRNHYRSLFRWPSRRMWVVALELFTSTVWAYATGVVFVLWTAGHFIDLPAPFSTATIPPGWSGVLLGTTCLLQFALSITIDSRYEPGLGRVYYWMIWYPMVYWMIQTAASVVAVPRALAKPSGRRAVWISPDRGLRPGRGA
jgi:biofilm PGA synthesis N-glycosyltransferase PgaC